MRTTITINDKLFRLLKMRAAETDSSLSDLVEQAVTYQVLEDIEDIEDAAKALEGPMYPFEDVMAEFRAEGLL
jgi:hypothetical protein